MDNNIDHLKKLIERLKTVSFWERLFGWRKIREQLMDAIADLQKLTTNADNLVEAVAELKATNLGLTKDLELINGKSISQAGEIAAYKSAGQEQAREISGLTAELASRDTTIGSQEQRIHQLENVNSLLTQRNEQLTADNTANSSEIATWQESLKKITERKNQLEIETEGLRRDIINVQNERDLLKQQNTRLLTEEDGRRKNYENEVAALTSIRTQIQNERHLEIEERNKAEIDRIKSLKDTWGKHQENVKNTIRTICNKHIIEYIDKVPFRGDPDNTLKICDEFVIFDAKSPASDDLKNFPGYLKDQAEKAKKYAKLEAVKKDIFLVVPSNTLEKLSQFVFNLGDFDVFIISTDSLEPVILALKKIEGYEFAEKLSPEERDNICRILGKFAHLTKRRIQIDSFFAKQFIELAYKTETDLPGEFLDKVVEFEKSEKLNPPIEKRAKVINTRELDKDTAKLKMEVAARGIFIDDTKILNGLNGLQLYQNETEEPH